VNVEEEWKKFQIIVNLTFIDPDGSTVPVDWDSMPVTDRMHAENQMKMTFMSQTFGINFETNIFVMKRLNSLCEFVVRQLAELKAIDNVEAVEAELEAELTLLYETEVTKFFNEQMDKLQDSVDEAEHQARVAKLLGSNGKPPNPKNLRSL
jgi:hypothetical protein